MAVKLTGIGVGPGDPELLTLKALKALREAEVIFVPGSLQGEGSLALRVAQGYLQASQEVITLHLPMTRNKKELEHSWQAASQTVAEHLRRSRRSVFLTLGDALLYSTLGYLLYGLQKVLPGVEIEVIPGVASPGAAAAALHLPLAEGREGLGFLPLPEDLEQLGRALELFPNLVLLKVGRRYKELYAFLAARGLAERAGLAVRLGQQGEQLARPLPPPEAVEGDYFSLVIVKGA